MLVLITAYLATYFTNDVKPIGNWKVASLVVQW